MAWFTSIEHANSPSGPRLGTPSVCHLGPVAQDFHVAFDIGADDQPIATVDADGVAPGDHSGVEPKADGRT